MNTKKLSLYATALLSTALVLGACTDKEIVKNAPTNEEIQSEFGFRSFDLDIDTVKKRDAIEASFDLDMSEIEAEYKNKLNNIKLSGDKAYSELQPIFKELGLTTDMSREEVIEKVSKAFGAEDYAEFDLEIEFTDGSEQEFSDMK
ncbi:YusW family protein [Sporosarcina psychrophila]|uniref:YusW family protein n=1 Tax=Sporosarcina psychrophila TaxID=1476 RepID=UPI0030CB1B76